jgi:hypothetical protein
MLTPDMRFLEGKSRIRARSCRSQRHSGGEALQTLGVKRGARGAPTHKEDP